ncbi:autotransporter domain-containing protein, partial [Bordetella avium]
YPTTPNIIDKKIVDKSESITSSSSASDSLIDKLEIQNGHLLIEGDTVMPRATGDATLTSTETGPATLTVTGGATLTIEGATTATGANGHPALVEVEKGAKLDLQKPASFENASITVSGTGSKLDMKQAELKNQATLSVTKGAMLTLTADATADDGNGGDLKMSGQENDASSVLVDGSTLYATSLTSGPGMASITVQNGAKVVIGSNNGATASISLNAKPQAAAAAAEPAALNVKEVLKPKASLLVTGQNSTLDATGITAGDKVNITLQNSAKLELGKYGLDFQGKDSKLIIGGESAAAAPGFLDSSEKGVKFSGDDTQQAIVFNHSDNSGSYVFEPSITGKGAVLQQAGYTVLNGQTLEGKTTVTGGTLDARQSHLSGGAEVQGGLLSMSAGTLGNTFVTNNGQIKVHGPVAVTGTFSLAGGTTLGVTIDDQTDPAQAQVKATGNVIVTGANLHVDAKPGVKIGEAYTLLEGSSLTGTFKDTTIDSNMAYLTSKVGYTDKTANVTFSQNGDLASLAETRNAAAAGRALETLPHDSELYQHVLTLPKGAPGAALQALSGDSALGMNAALQTMAISAPQINVPMTILHRNLTAGLRAGAPLAQGSGTYPAAALPSSAAQPMWAEVVGNWQRDKGNASNPGMRASNYGLYIGADHAIGKQWRLGAAVGYSNTHVNINNRSASGSIDNYSLSLYGGRGWDAGNGRLNLMLGTAYTWHDIGTSRNMAAALLPETLTADYGASTAQLFGEVGYLMPLSSKASVEPYLGLSWNNLRTRAFDESGGTAALSGQATNQHSLTTTLGLRSQWKYELGKTQGVLRAGVGYRNLSGDLTSRGKVAFNGSQSFSINGNAIARSTGLVEIGTDLAVSRNGTLALNYAGEFGEGNTQHTAKIQARWAF